MANLLEQREWDYVVGSVHFLGDHAVDYDRYDVWTTRRARRTRSGARTSTWLGEAARSGLFDILAHPDLVKMWGAERPRPEGDLRRFYDRAMEGDRRLGHRGRGLDRGAAQAGRQIYPDRAFLEMVVDAGNPIALSSDAHTPDQLGFRVRATRWSCSPTSASPSCASSTAASGTLEPIGAS